MSPAEWKVLDCARAWNRCVGAHGREHLMALIRALEELDAEEAKPSVFNDIWDTAGINDVMRGGAAPLPPPRPSRLVMDFGAGIAGDDTSPERNRT